MKRAPYRLRRLLLFAAITVLAACSRTPASHFYTLTPTVAPEVGGTAGKTASRLTVEIMPVEVPDSLARPQMVTRDGSNGLKLAEFDRWAGRLSDNIASVMVENLVQLLGTDQVFVDPGFPQKADYYLELRVLRLDCLPGDHVLLKAQWTVFAGTEYKSLGTHVASFTRRLSDTQYETMAAALSGTLGELSREIARQLPAGPPTPSAQSGGTGSSSP